MQDDDSPRKVHEYETSGDGFYKKPGIESSKEALKVYGKAYTEAKEKGLMGKMPPLILKVGKCQRRLAEMETDFIKRIGFARFASRQTGLAIWSSLNNETCNQSEEWTRGAVSQASEIADFYFTTLLSDVKDEEDRLTKVATFAKELFPIQVKNHPFLDVAITVNQQVAYTALDLASKFLRAKDHQSGRQCLQTMLISLHAVESRFALQQKNDPDSLKDLKILTEDYTMSCDIAQALEALEAGGLIASLAVKEMESNELDSALNHGWNALDKFKEAGNLTEATVDEIYYHSKSAQGFLYLNIFKNPAKAKKIYTELVDSAASENHRDKEWFQEAERGLRTMEANNPVVQKRKLLEELQPELEKMKKTVKEAGSDVQKIINFFYSNYPPIPTNDGTPRPKPLVSKLGEARVIKKVIFSYHPDKIRGSDMKYKLMCEEITKIFTEIMT